METATTHCQICGRPIKAKNGIIAHHGYTRPQGWGGQTASCHGARHRPYEVAHDAIDRVIVLVTEWLAEAEANLAEWNTSPPDSIKYIRRDAYGKVRQEQTHARPEGFDPATAFDTCSLRDYAGLYFNGRSERRRAIAGLTEQLAYLRQRLADWSPPK